MTSGIYKITSPTGKIYVGQSVNIHKRFLKYKKLNCKSQSKLYRSFLKHGLDNHIFEVIEYCEVCKLNELERYWQDEYSVLKKGLNCILTTTASKTGKLSDKTKLKLSMINIGKKMSEESKKKMSEYRKGKKLSDFSKEKIRAINLGKKLSQETKDKMSNSRKKKVKDKESNIIYNSIKECSEINCISYSKLKLDLKKNNTKYTYNID